MGWSRPVLGLLVCLALWVVPGGGGAAAAATRDCTAVTAIRSRPAVRAGDKGSCVRTLQNLLLTKGYSMGTMWPGGVFNKETSAMLAAWQKANGRPIAARVDAATWKAIAGSPTRKGYTVTRGPNTSRKVVLSYDDCPTSLARFKATVKAAKRLGIALMLFPTGNCLKSGKFSTSYARQHGHYVFNHSVSHPNLAELNYQKAKAQLGKPGVVTSFGRPPYGAFDATVKKAYKARKMHIWTWTYDTEDYRRPSQATILSRVVRNATAGSTILMHMQHKAFNPAALKAMVNGLAGRGLEVCANHPGTTPAAPKSLRC